MTEYSQMVGERTVWTSEGYETQEMEETILVQNTTILLHAKKLLLLGSFLSSWFISWYSITGAAFS